MAAIAALGGTTDSRHGLLAQQAAVPSTAASDFAIYLRGAQIGTEQIALTRGAGGWTITSSGRIGPPLDIVTRSLLIRYDPGWKPLELTLDACQRTLANYL